MNKSLETLLTNRAAAEADYQKRLNDAKAKMDGAEKALTEMTASKKSMNFEEYRTAKNLYRDAQDYYEILLKENTDPSEKEMEEYRTVKKELAVGRSAIYADTIRKLEKPVAEIEKILSEAVNDQQTITSAINDLSIAFEHTNSFYLDAMTSVSMNRCTGSLIKAVNDFKSHS